MDLYIIEKRNCNEHNFSKAPLVHVANRLWRPEHKLDWKMFLQKVSTKVFPHENIFILKVN